MKPATSLKHLLALTVVVSMIAATTVASAAPRRPRVLGGEAAITALGKRLPAVARSYGQSATQLKRRLRQEKHLRVDAAGKLLYVDALPTAAQIAAAGAADSGLLDSSSIPADQTFELNSRPGSSRTLYLDFDGHLLSGTAWNASYGIGDTVCPPFDIDGNPAFSSEELSRIRQVWARVAEDYAPFDVNVTTRYPGETALTRSDSSDTVFGTRVLISPISKYFGNYGGVSYVNVFSRVGDYYKPSLVFPENLANSAKYVAEAASHEAGHALGLSHDGVTGVTEYYAGHGTGETGWAPIMGNSYSRQLTQWSKGEYPGASNKQDDLIVIAAGGAPLIEDDVAGTNELATVIDPVTKVSGLLGMTGDVDVYALDAGSGSFSAAVGLASLGSNADILLEVVDSTGRVIASSNAPDVLGASAAAWVTAGRYYLRVMGTGKGDLSTGYSDYASLGVYSLTVNAATPESNTNLTPVARITASPDTGVAPLPVDFDGSGSSDDDGTIVSWVWDFGDGATAAGPTVAHTYGEAGVYTTTLTVTDDRGSTSSANQLVDVQAAPVVLKVMHVQEITLDVLRPTSRSSQVRGVVRILSAAGQPVPSASVGIRWSGRANGSAVATTDANGNATFVSKAFKNSGTVTLTVAGVSLNGWTFDAAAGPTSASVYASATTVRQSRLIK